MHSCSLDPVDHRGSALRRVGIGRGDRAVKIYSTGPGRPAEKRTGRDMNIYYDKDADISIIRGLKVPLSVTARRAMPTPTTSRNPASMSPSGCVRARYPRPRRKTPACRQADRGGRERGRCGNDPGAGRAPGTLYRTRWRRISSRVLRWLCPRLQYSLPADRAARRPGCHHDRAQGSGPPGAFHLHPVPVFPV